ncbi:glycosyltransferase family 4 protein [Vampirovibrio sp.]|uniref:glycosyltransferase family 4 protein n=1 Tax=Vampirovibrio sp. TaxID=2717857 RepID=UPI003594142E
MRIAQIAPLWELVPPKAYGGTELVAHLLTEGLVARGHEVTLFAAAGSQTSARFHPYASKPLRELEEAVQKDKTHCTVMSTELKMLEDIFQQAEQFDVIHNHMGFQALAFADFVETPMVTTLHNALIPQPVHDLFMRNAHLPYISISNYQQKLWPGLNYVDTIYHGIDLTGFDPCFTHSEPEYLAFLGRLSPEKGPQHAIRVAKALGKKLILAGKIDRVDRLFYEQELAHHIDGDQISYIGELDHQAKVAFLRKAVACLFPVEWPEPFGLVMIEAMACGTPVFALRDGSVPEVIDHGLSGYVADSLDELIQGVGNYLDFDRRLVRKIAEDRFSVARMIDDHERVYERLAGGGGRSLSLTVSRKRIGASSGKQPPLPLTPYRGGEAKPLPVTTDRTSRSDDSIWLAAGPPTINGFSADSILEGSKSPAIQHRQRQDRLGS